MSELVLHYMAPLPNAVLVRCLGIYSYNRQARDPIVAGLRDKGIVVSIADPAVNFRRHRRRIGTRWLHDYVPLYWATHTPMQYVITVRDRTIDQDHLVFFLVDAEAVFLLDGVWSTDGNAASANSREFHHDGAVAYLDWELLRCRDASRYGYSAEFKRRKAAEVLVPDHVPTQIIGRVVVRTSDTKQVLADSSVRLAAALKQDLAALPPIDVRPSLYY